MTIEEQKPYRHIFRRDSSMSSDFLNYSKLSSEHNWEDLCTIRLRDQQTCTFDNRVDQIFNVNFGNVSS